MRPTVLVKITRIEIEVGDGDLAPGPVHIFPIPYSFIDVWQTFATLLLDPTVDYLQVRIERAR